MNSTVGSSSLDNDMKITLFFAGPWILATHNSTLLNVSRHAPQLCPHFFLDSTSG